MLVGVRIITTVNCDRKDNVDAAHPNTQVASEYRSRRALAHADNGICKVLSGAEPSHILLHRRRRHRSELWVFPHLALSVSSDVFKVISQVLVAACEWSLQYSRNELFGNY